MLHFLSEEITASLSLQKENIGMGQVIERAIWSRQNDYHEKFLIQ